MKLGVDQSIWERSSRPTTSTWWRDCSSRMRWKFSCPARFWAIHSRANAPFFVWPRAEDPYVPAKHSYRLAAALAAQNVRQALHVFSGVPTAWGLPLAQASPPFGQSWPRRGLPHAATLSHDAGH